MPEEIIDLYERLTNVISSTIHETSGNGALKPNQLIQVGNKKETIEQIIRIWVILSMAQARILDLKVMESIGNITRNRVVLALNRNDEITKTPEVFLQRFVRPAVKAILGSSVELIEKEDIKTDDINLCDFSNVFLNIPDSDTSPLEN